MRNNISLEVEQIIWSNIFSDPMTLFNNCLCMAKLLAALGSAFNEVAPAICVHEEEEAGVACIPACLDNDTCLNKQCPLSTSGHVDICGMYDKNSTSQFANVLVISIGLNCRSIFQHANDICSSVLSKKEYLVMVGNMHF